MTPGRQPLGSTAPPAYNTPSSAAAAAERPTYTMPAVASSGSVMVIHGDTSGNSTVMSLTVDGIPALIVSARPGLLFWRVPELTPGLHLVTLHPGPGRKPVDLPLYILRLIMSADLLNLMRGQWTLMHVMITGLDRLPESAWQYGQPPAELLDLQGWASRNGGVSPPNPSGPGTVVLVLENKSPETIRMGKKGDRIVLELRQQDFAKGPYVYEDRLQSIKSGGFDIRGAVTAFLSPVASSPM
jgi:hypothetical protein